MDYQEVFNEADMTDEQEEATSAANKLLLTAWMLLVEAADGVPGPIRYQSVVQLGDDGPEFQLEFNLTGVDDED